MRKQYLQYFSNQNKRLQYLTVGLVILVVAAIGTYLLTNSHAASTYASTTATRGTLAGGAATCPAVGASTTNSVVFSPPISMDGTVALDLSCTGTPFSPTSFWNTPLPDNTPASPNSTEYINDIASDLCGETTLESTSSDPCSNPANIALNTSTWSAPLYVVPANQPLVSVIRNPDESISTTFNNAVAGGVPVPADAHGSGETVSGSHDTDEEIQIYQPSTDKYWDFWQFQKDSSGGWEASWGGVIDNVSTSNGIFPNNTGATATSLPLIGATPRIEEFQAGHIDHVIGLMLANNLSSSVSPANCMADPENTSLNVARAGISWPASRTDGSSTNPCAVPEGQRFRLPASFNLTAYVAQHPLTPIAMTIAVAAQNYGFVIYDTTNAAGIRISDPTTYTNTPTPHLSNPYTFGPGVGGVGDSGLGSISMANFPWNQLVALPFNYGEPSN